MEERQKMCIYYESSNRWSFEYYCKSPGNAYPSDARQKGKDCFRNLCCRADDHGWQCKCERFIEPVSTVFDQLTAEDETTEGGNVHTAGSGKSNQRRASGRLTYLSQMKTGNRQPSGSSANAPQCTSPGQDQKDSGFADSILKAGAKVAIDMGKAALDPMGSTTDIVADAAKRFIDEL